MAEFPTYAQMAKDIAEKALDEYLINGKALREWIKTIAVQDPKTGWISRQAAIDAIRRIGMCKCSTNEIEAVDECRRSVEDLPFFTAEPKTGHWEWVQYDSNPKIGNWHCSECRTIIPFMPEETDDTPIYKWCPMCGRKMESEVQK